MGFFENKIVQILISSLIPLIGAWIIGYGSQRNMYPWYNTINRPSWGPPDWVFAPVWTYIYLSMGYASYRVWQSGSGFVGAAKLPLMIYIAQLVLNWTWTQVFFNLHLIGAATIHIVVLLMFIIATGVTFFKVDQLAGLLIVPYAAWVSFASYLCFAIWRLNS